MAQDLTHSRIVFFDGVCNLCNAAIDFLIRRDPKGVLQFASLQGSTFKSMNLPGLSGDDLHTVILYESGAIFIRSEAVIRALACVSWKWRWVMAFLIIPRPIRDSLYKFIARHRYRWFGKRDTCRLPTPEERARFLA